MQRLATIRGFQKKTAPRDLAEGDRSGVVRRVAVLPLDFDVAHRIGSAARKGGVIHRRNKRGLHTAHLFAYFWGFSKLKNKERTRTAVSECALCRAGCAIWLTD